MWVTIRSRVGVSAIPASSISTSVSRVIVWVQSAAPVGVVEAVEEFGEGVAGCGAEVFGEDVGGPRRRGRVQ